MNKKEKVSISIKDDIGIKYFSIDAIKQEPENAYIALTTFNKNEVEKMKELAEIIRKKITNSNSIHVDFFEENNLQGYQFTVWIQFEKEINLEQLDLQIFED